MLGWYPPFDILEQDFYPQVHSFQEVSEPFKLCADLFMNLLLSCPQNVLGPEKC